MGLQITEHQHGILTVVAHFAREGRMSIAAELVKKFGLHKADVTGVGDYDRCQLARLNSACGLQMTGLGSIEP